MVPLIGMADARSTELFTDDGLPTGGDGWEEIDFPDFGTSEQVFALEVTGDAMVPLYRDGDVLMLSPTARSARATGSWCGSATARSRPAS